MENKKRIVLASGNSHKIKEISDIGLAEIKSALDKKENN